MHPMKILPRHNISWDAVPWDAHVELVGVGKSTNRAYVVNHYAVAYWSGSEARVAQRYLDAVMNGLVTGENLYQYLPPSYAIARPLTLYRDGKPVRRGDWAQLATYIHDTHSFSIGWALKHEGYSIQEDPHDRSAP